MLASCVECALSTEMCLVKEKNHATAGWSSSKSLQVTFLIHVTDGNVVAL